MTSYNIILNSNSTDLSFIPQKNMKNDNKRHSRNRNCRVYSNRKMYNWFSFSMILLCLFFLNSFFVFSVDATVNLLPTVSPTLSPTRSPTHSPSRSPTPPPIIATLPQSTTTTTSSSLTSEPTSTTPIVSPTPLPSSSPLLSRIPPTSPPDFLSAITANAAAVIGLVVAVGVCLLCALIFCIYAVTRRVPESSFSRSVSEKRILQNSGSRRNVRGPSQRALAASVPFVISPNSLSSTPPASSLPSSSLMPPSSSPSPAVAAANATPGPRHSPVVSGGFRSSLPESVDKPGVVGGVGPTSSTMTPPPTTTTDSGGAMKMNPPSSHSTPTASQTLLDTKAVNTPTQVEPVKPRAASPISSIEPL